MGTVIFLFIGVFVLWVAALTAWFILCVLYELLRTLVLFLVPPLRPAYLKGSAKQQQARVKPTFDAPKIVSEDDIVIPFRRGRSP